MRIGVIKETYPNEFRVAISPDSVIGYTELGLEVWVETNAGLASGFSDNMYIKSGAQIVDIASKILRSCDIILKVTPPTEAQLREIRNNTLLIGMLANDEIKSLLPIYAEQKISAFALEFLPRISRTQSMDVLSSQSNLSGYKAVIDAVAHYGRVVPMMTTAAGSIKPARVMVLGAGVAGLQAIATAKRLGAIVCAFDVRAEVKEQVQSLGAKFIEVESEKQEHNLVYAKEMSEKYKEKQSRLIADTLTKQDIVICTALIPGKKAPILITEEMVKNMPNGSIIVDLATVNGGNCQISERNQIVKKYGTTIIGYDNFPSRLSQEASRLYSNNLLNFTKLFVSTKLNRIRINVEDEIIQKTMLSHNGKIIHPNYKLEFNA